VLAPAAPTFAWDDRRGAGAGSGSGSDAGTKSACPGGCKAFLALCADNASKAASSTTRTSDALKSDDSPTEPNSRVLRETPLPSAAVMTIVTCCIHLLTTPTTMEPSDTTMLATAIDLCDNGKTLGKIRQI
jgi:hypothetical protein